MPNRMIKESIRTSKTVNALTDFQFRLWLYLITYVDDYGRGSADPELLKGLVFPRRKGATESQIRDALSVLANTGMITLYDVDGESYFYFPKWGEHQRIQSKYSKYPEPPAETPEKGASRKVTESHGKSRTEEEVQEEVEIQVQPQADDARAGADGFERFWAAYPRKDKKKEARQVWDKLKPSEDLLQTMLAAIEEQKRGRNWIEGYIPQPPTWLRGERWTDKPAPPPRKYNRFVDYGSGNFEQKPVKMEDLTNIIDLNSDEYAELEKGGDGK